MLCREHAVDIIHPDLLTTGGILETKKIGDMAQEYGVPMALHCAHTPIGALASAHVAAATENFLVLENHAVDVPYWSDLVDGVEKPIVNKGYITVSLQLDGAVEIASGQTQAAVVPGARALH